MKFIIDQVALYPTDPEKAMELLNEMGAGDWAKDHVVAVGNVYNCPGQNEADLAYNYDTIDGRELEVLHYTDGDNWMDAHKPRVSHLGMHCSAKELVEWKRFFRERNIGTAQEVLTCSHTNPVIVGKRKYNYVIFDTYAILGVDVKFIVRLNEDGTPFE